MMLPKEIILKTFYIINKIDNIPVLLSDTEKIIQNFEFALRIDPFLYSQLLTYSNLEGFGFKNNISRIDEIPLILDEKILQATLKSNVQLDIENKWYNEWIYYLLIFPTYLSFSELLLEPDWLTEEEINYLTLIPTGFALRKLFYSNEYKQIKELSDKKNIPIIKAEKILNYPSATLLTNLFFVNKNIPINLPNYDSKIDLNFSIGKISFILKFLDLFLLTRLYSKSSLRFNAISYFESRIEKENSFSIWYDILLNKINLLFNYLLTERLKDNIFQTLEKCYNREKKRSKRRKKVPITNRKEKISHLEEI